MTERFATTTTVRQPRTALMWGLTAGMVAMFLASLALRFVISRDFGALMQLPFWVVGPALAAIQRNPKIRRAAIDASPVGLRIGGELVPRSALTTALLRRENEKTFVVLRGGGAFAPSVDVQVSDDDQAGRLTRALGLDAASTKAELIVHRTKQSRSKGRILLVSAVLSIGFIAGWAAALSTVPPAIIPILLLLPVLALVGALPLVVLNQRVKLLVGADGIVVRDGLRKRFFVPHDEITSVASHGASVVITLKHRQLVYRVGSDSGRQVAADFERTAQSVVWRIEKAREAYRALAGDAPQAALVLDRGESNAREWLERLRRIGEGANATFRSIQLTREQLLRIVESTSAAAKERLAAAAALHDGLTEEEKPRVRVAAERCVEPALGDRMVRVAFAPSDDELEAALVSDDDDARAAS